MPTVTTTVFADGLRQGDTEKLKLDYGGDNDITGFKWWLTLKEEFDQPDAEAALQVSTAAGDHVDDDPAHGIAYLVFTVTAPAGCYYYDLQERSAAGEIRTLLPLQEDYRTKLRVYPQVTQATT